MRTIDEKQTGRRPPFPRLLERLTQDERDWFLARASRRDLQRGELVFCQRDPVDDIFVIDSGRVKAYHTTPNGQSITFAYWTEGMVMGMPGLSGRFNHLWTAEAVAPTTLLRLDRAHFVSLVEGSPRAARCMIEILEFKAKYLSKLTHLLCASSILERLQIVLLHVCELYGQEAADGIRIDLPLTHAEIADMVGASRQWVTTSLGRLERAGLIRSHNRRITVLDTDALNGDGLAEPPTTGSATVGDDEWRLLQEA